MFSKAKRFEHLAPNKQLAVSKKHEVDTLKPKIKVPAEALASKTKSCPLKSNTDAHSQCSSAKSVKSFVTPKPVKAVIKAPASLKKPLSSASKPDKTKTTVQDDIMQAQEVEIRNKDYTIAEYNKQIEELKNEISNLQTQLKQASKDLPCLDKMDQKLSEITLNDANVNSENNQNEYPQQGMSYYDAIDEMKHKISELEKLCDKLEQEVSSKQVELTSLEEIITIRDSLCKDLQDKLSNAETCLDETKQRLEMVKGHHDLALEANESIRREYKAELDILKTKFEEEKLSLIAKCKVDQDSLKSKYDSLIESIKSQLINEKDEIVRQLQQQLVTKEAEMKAKLEQIDEATHEKMRICEIQFEERSRTLQEHWSQQQKKVKCLEKDTKDLKYELELTEEQNIKLDREISNLKTEIDSLRTEKLKLLKETNQLKEASKKKLIDFENEINKLTAEVKKVTKEKNKFEMSLSVTRDIVQVLSMRLRESDNELEHLEGKVQTLTNAKEMLEDELTTYKNTLSDTVLECNEYKNTLVNILKSKAALAKEHNRIMEHNVTLIESLQNVEKEAYRELSSIKTELIEDVEVLKKESDSQIQLLCKEVEEKRALCKLASEHAGQATAAAEQSRVLLARASAELARLENDNERLQQQIQDQQSLVVELSLLRQENEELTMTVAKQSSIIDKMKKDEQIQIKPKSPSVMRKTHKAGKENLQVVISPLRERNH